MSTTTSTWWNGRWAARGGLALVPIGALVGIVAAVVELRQVEPALISYVVGAVVFGAVGFVVGGLAGGLRRRTRRVVALPQPARTRWVVHTAAAPRQARSA